jgi:biopolymer transport protein ExbD
VQINRRNFARPGISLTPLIDVVFILLLFFMLASDLHRIHALPLAAPTSTTGMSGSVSALLLRVHRDGSFSLTDQRLDNRTLSHRIRSYLVLDPEQAVVVQPDGDVLLQSLVDVLDHLTEMGVVKLSLGQH